MGLSKTKTQLVERIRNPRFRAREGAFLVEGIRGVGETLQATLPLESRFAVVSPRLGESDDGRSLAEQLGSAPFPVEEVEDAELAALSDTERHQGVMLVVSEPGTGWETLDGPPSPRVLLLDGIQDPGNVGTLIRAARAFGLDGVVALKGTVDPWNPKVVRASAGSHAHTPILRASVPEALAWLEERKIPLWLADARGEDVRDGAPNRPWALAVGNEGAGPRKEIMERSVRTLAIPMAPGVDSLNAGTAGAILLFALCGPTSEREGI
ncbi:TrmH family RNA methyltransferase [Gemmatimonadota bacterium]